MKGKHILLIVGAILLLFGLFLIYVIPYGKKVKTFNKSYYEFKSKADNIFTSLNNPVQLSFFNNSLEEIITFPSNLQVLRSSLINLKNEENFIKTIWAKTPIKESDLDQISVTVIDTYKRLPQLVSLAIERECKANSMKILKINDLEQLTSIVTTFKGDFEKLFSDLNKATTSADFNKDTLNFSKIKEDKILIGLLGDDGLEKIKELHANNYKSTKSAIVSYYTLKETSQTTSDHIAWLKSSKYLVNLLSSLGTNMQKTLSCNSNLDKDLEEMKSFLILYDNIIEAEKKSNNILKNALSLMDEANERLQNMERFASAGDIRPVYVSWSNAENEVLQAKYALNPRGVSGEREKIWNNIVSKPKANIDKILENVSKHKNFVYAELHKATQEESTFLGGATRSAQRGFARLRGMINSATQQVAQSRIGREVSIGVKTLILGTKAFYDLQNPNTDLMTWGMSYEDDVNQLMNETNAVMEMDGPSLTGKNTFIEDFVNRSYANSFK